MFYARKKETLKSRRVFRRRRRRRGLPFEFRKRERERENNNNNNNKTRFYRYHQYHAFVKVYVTRGVPFPCRGLKLKLFRVSARLLHFVSRMSSHCARIYILPHLRSLLLFKSQHTMYVEEVCIDGFKSYAQRTIVPQFDQYFNAITGLNGSGKSNILDSICFVLGITNLSQVRTLLVTM